jgi:hypothetical protein
LRGQGLDYNHATGIARLAGRVQATMAPVPARPGAVGSTKPPSSPATKP